MVINAVCEKSEQESAIKDIDGIGRIFGPRNTMPYVMRNDDEERCLAFLTEPFLLVRTLDELGFLRYHDYKGEIVTDHTLYNCNAEAYSFLKEQDVYRTTVPLELSYHEMEEGGIEDSELMVYGRVPMMISAGCVRKTSMDGGCMGDGRSLHEEVLTDRMNVRFPVICVCRYCYNIILNSCPLSLHKDKDKISKLSPKSIRLYFTTEEPGECVKIARYFTGLFNDDVCIDPPYGQYTRGHFIKGVE